MQDETTQHKPDVIIVYDYDHAPSGELKVILLETFEKLGKHVFVTEKSMAADLKKAYGNDVAIIELKTVDEL